MTQSQTIALALVVSALILPLIKLVKMFIQQFRSSGKLIPFVNEVDGLLAHSHFTQQTCVQDMMNVLVAAGIPNVLERMHRTAKRENLTVVTMCATLNLMSRHNAQWIPDKRGIIMFCELGEVLFFLEGCFPPPKDDTP